MIRYILNLGVILSILFTFSTVSFAGSRSSYLAKAKHYAKQANLYLKLSKKYPKKSTYYRKKATRFAKLSRQMYKMADKSKSSSSLGDLTSAFKGKKGKKDWRKLLGGAWKLGNTMMNSKKKKKTSKKQPRRKVRKKIRRKVGKKIRRKTLKRSLKNSMKIMITARKPSIVGAINAKKLVHRVNRFYIGHLRFCYRFYLKKSASLHNRLVLSFGLSPKGRVSFVRVLTKSRFNTIRHKGLITCIRRRVKRWRFSKPTNNKKAKVTYVFSFKH